MKIIDVMQSVYFPVLKQNKYDFRLENVIEMMEGITEEDFNRVEEKNYARMKTILADTYREKGSYIFLSSMIDQMEKEREE